MRSAPRNDDRLPESYCISNTAIPTICDSVFFVRHHIFHYDHECLSSVRVVHDGTRPRRGEACPFNLTAC
jgi:hypothetical protein